MKTAAVILAFAISLAAAHPQITGSPTGSSGLSAITSKPTESTTVTNGGWGGFGPFGGYNDNWGSSGSGPWASWTTSWPSSVASAFSSYTSAHPNGPSSSDWASFTSAYSITNVRFFPASIFAASTDTFTGSLGLRYSHRRLRWLRWLRWLDSRRRFSLRQRCLGSMGIYGFLDHGCLDSLVGWQRLPVVRLGWLDIWKLELQRCMD